jgi:hypothetical protein
MSVTYVSFAEALLDRLGLPRSDNNVRALVAFQAQEGGHENGAHFNPLNTMRGTPTGDNDLPSVNFSTHKTESGVQSFENWHDGLEATARTMLQTKPGFDMSPIVKALKASAPPAQTMDIIAKSPWGWGKIPHAAADAVVNSDATFKTYATKVYSGVGSLDYARFLPALPSHWKTFLAVGAVAIGATMILSFVAKNKPAPARSRFRVLRGA